LADVLGELGYMATKERYPVVLGYQIFSFCFARPEKLNIMNVNYSGLGVCHFDRGYWVFHLLPETPNLFFY
jgi:hypothetical protein